MYKAGRKKVWLRWLRLIQGKEKIKIPINGYLLTIKLTIVLIRF